MVLKFRRTEFLVSGSIYPGARQGFVLGSEIREGCIVPTIADGICQLSNALYDAALKANFEIIERHQHSKIIRGSLAERGRDATVKWNYKTCASKLSEVAPKSGTHFCTT